jgi:hypothetical protein
MSKTYHIPNLKKIVRMANSHKAGFGIDTYTGKFHKQEILEQGSTPEDPKLLTKLGIKKRQRILAIAGYYASWASQLAKQEAKVDYSDVSQSMVNWSRRKYGKLFSKYLCSPYESIPKNQGEYNWTFTFEACGGKQGLPIAYLRSLLNKDGGILVMAWRKEKAKMGSKPKQYPLIVRTIGQIYGAHALVEDINFRGHIKGQPTTAIRHGVYKILTNNSARKEATLDLRVLEDIQHKNAIVLEEEAERLGINRKDLTHSLNRLDAISRKLIEEKFRKPITIRNH